MKFTACYRVLDTGKVFINEHDMPFSSLDYAEIWSQFYVDDWNGKDPSKIELLGVKLVREDLVKKRKR